jgi:hypothetical protein
VAKCIHNSSQSQVIPLSAHDQHFGEQVMQSQTERIRTTLDRGDWLAALRFDAYQHAESSALCLTGLSLDHLAGGDQQRLGGCQR